MVVNNVLGKTKKRGAQVTRRLESLMVKLEMGSEIQFCG